MRLSGFLALITLIAASLSFAEEPFVYKSRTCKVWIKDKMDERSDMHEAFIKVIKNKGYIPEVMVDNKRIFEGDIYFELKKSILKEREVRETSIDDDKLEVKNTRKAKLIYKDCQITLKLKQAKNRIISELDPTMYEGTSIRSHPRVTFEGNERCIRALWDASVNIPPCKKP
ncbi:MAG: hypothetical protein Fur0010_06150 [Bdellovibrio sp.]